MNIYMLSISGENKHFGAPVNPVAPDRRPGECSSGSAVAVAGGLVDFSLGELRFQKLSCSHFCFSNFFCLHCNKCELSCYRDMQLPSQNRGEFE